ncbi:MAG: aKG-HExxH-type peptide beta-hydroxylase, partial [Trebonia sp.]
CGGGLYAHRYRTGSGFDNPSVYCGDLEKIISHVRADEAVRRRPGHSMAQAHFDALAAGYGDAAAISSLNAAQRSVRRVLLHLLRERVTEDASGTFSGGWDLLTRLDRSSPAAVDEVLAHPYVRAWAERCLRAGGPMAAEADHVASIAAAAAIRSGTLTELVVPVTDGYVHLPTLGRLRVGETPTATLAARGEGAFEVRASSGKWHVKPGTEGDPGADGEQDWQPVRELRAGELTVALEDTDPYRDCHQWPVAGRLSADEAAAWQARFAEAWQLIEGTYPRYAPGVAAGLTAVLPLANDVPGREISAAARQAFGSVGAALPASGSDLALLLLHEFQHGKLYAVLDLFDLCDPADSRLYYAPWREDPRPLEALLQGTYAHLAVTDFWRVRRHELSGPDALTAAERFARWRMLTAEAVETLAGSGALSPSGARFVDGMRATVQPWL